MARKSCDDGGNGPAAETPRAKLLVVDEDISDTCEFCALLRQCGFEVRCLCSYLEGAAYVRNEPVDLVIVSQGTPEFEGRCVVERAIERDRHTPVLVLARCADMNCYLEAMQLGAFDYLEKPVSPGEILKLVATHIRSRN
jgi:DNA-binding NtrC family response regulator